jgi:hypothetical protein
MKARKRKKISRVFPGASVLYRGKARNIIAELNTDAGTIIFRLAGCRRRKTYTVTDLWTFKPTTPQLSLQLEFPQT